MTAAQNRGWERFLRGFVPAGVLLVMASWLITGEKSVGFGLLPFALLGIAWLGLRNAEAKGQGDAG